MLINKNQTHRRTVRVRVPAGASAAVTEERMAAPSVKSTAGVTLGGRTYGAATASGRLGPPVVSRLSAASGTASACRCRTAAPRW